MPTETPDLPLILSWQRAMDDAHQERDQLIQRCVRSGVCSATDIAEALGLSRQRIYQIVWEVEGAA